MEEVVTLIAGLLVLAALTSAHPYSPYSDYKVDEPKNVQLSEEAVAAYLKSKMDKEKLDPETIVEYVESLLQAGDKSTPQIQGGGKGKSKPSETETSRCLIIQNFTCKKENGESVCFQDIENLGGVCGKGKY